ncbi:hypothetical protein K457DRAFT_392329 [Linnemannia elongata AG-77]|uniref:Uncharacterized protein n=1 Tax=Linnemannia elongata AG-77 TaxID=1314771 RepID=A0A197K119_9FUNG|nr:hypothetical protein K457DRAFT_392329 [Linnemannia elongata AG-77]
MINVHMCIFLMHNPLYSSNFMSFCRLDSSKTFMFYRNNGASSNSDASGRRSRNGLNNVMMVLLLLLDNKLFLHLLLHLSLSLIKSLDDQINLCFPLQVVRVHHHGCRGHALKILRRVGLCLDGSLQRGCKHQRPARICIIFIIILCASSSSAPATVGEPLGLFPNQLLR